ncbi:MAG TPA: adenylate/guanylate cyclase domain-containing protein [Anaerolineales bacterium]|nr:adenylate/guanylate cyclase domain-containing protein [Anaerolineales bacterium]
MICPKCQTVNPASARFCLNCGNALAITCANCGTSLPADARFCFNCGHPVTAEGESQVPSAASDIAPPAIEPAQAPGDLLNRYIPKELLSKLEVARRAGAMESERRVVTMLFCDVKGSTSAASELDPEDWASIMNGAFEHMIRPVYRYEGTVARLMGDGLLAFFGAPIAHEDDPQRAVLAGLEIVQAIGRYCAQVNQQWGIVLDVRVGINTGLVVVGAVGSDLRMEYTAMGDAINLAARMEQTAQPGTVQIAEPTHRLVRPLFDIEPLGEVEVKGRAERVNAYRVLAVKAEPGRLRGIAGLEAPLIGREAPMAAMGAALSRLQGGAGGIISVIGEAGLGKSRLVVELHNSIQAGSALSVLWLEGRSLSYETNTPFAPFSDIFRGFFELGAEQTDAGRYARIKSVLEAFHPGQGESVAPFFATMLGVGLNPEEAERVKYLEPPHLRGLIFNSVRELIEKLALSQRLVLFLDDLHWIDPTSLELLQSLLPLTDRLPLMMIAAFRPHRQEPSWGFHQSAERDYPHRYQAVHLDPLDKDQSRQLITSLLHIEDLPESVRQLILDKSEGNPFFVEEVIRSLLDRGLVIRENSHWRAAQEIKDIALPDTLAGVITSRLDRLDENTRRLLQGAAVLGREFSEDILARVLEADGAHEADGALEAHLAELQRRELVREVARHPQRTYIFKHVLTQEAAYNSILLSKRRELHHRAAEALIHAQPDLVGEIGRHLLEARQPNQALPYLVQAGDRAARAYATAEAIDYYNQVLNLRTALNHPELVRRAYEGLGQTLTNAYRIPEAQKTFNEMLDLAENSQDISMQISALNKLASLAALYMGQFQEAEVYLARAEKLSAEHDDVSGAGETALIRCQMCTAQADFDSAMLHMDELVEIGEQVGSREYMALGLEHVSSSLLYMTRFEEAFEKALEALDVSREVGDRMHESWVLSFTLPMCYIRNGDFDSARAALNEGLQIAMKIGALESVGLANWLLAQLACWQGDYERALDFGQTAVQNALPLEQYLPYILVPPLGTLGSIYLEISGHFTDKVLELHKHALRLLESPVGALTGGVVWADLGYCAIAMGDQEMAEQVFQKGLSYPTIFSNLERPRHLAGAGLLACIRGNLDEALSLVEQAQAYARERGMRHLYPLTALAAGQVHLARSEVDKSLASFEQAESDARALGMRPMLWQACNWSARALVNASHHDQAQSKRNQARAVVEELARQFQDGELRDAYRVNALTRIGMG